MRRVEQQKQAAKPVRSTRRNANANGGQNLKPPRADTSTYVYPRRLPPPTRANGIAHEWPPIAPIFGWGNANDFQHNADATADELEMERAQMARERLCVTKGEAAKMLAVSVSTIDKLHRQGLLPFVKIGTCARISVKALSEYVDGLAS